jgi:hypothetical protein
MREGGQGAGWCSTGDIHGQERRCTRIFGHRGDRKGVRRPSKIL